MSLYLLNKLENPKFIYKWYRKCKQNIRINIFNEENINKIKKLRDQLSK